MSDQDNMSAGQWNQVIPREKLSRERKRKQEQNKGKNDKRKKRKKLFTTCKQAGW